ncbi:hypothetical protein OF83DRAFT_1159269 [Amylostereum chailletii]|nr:hypothetical protein OF83DRAFT_1159269 [Amylostereum chailletii]
MLPFSIPSHWLSTTSITLLFLLVDVERALRPKTWAFPVPFVRIADAKEIRVGRVPGHFPILEIVVQGEQPRFRPTTASPRGNISTPESDLTAPDAT